MQAVKDSSNGTDTITFKYDPFGRRIEKNVETVEGGLPTTYKYTYVYDNEDIIIVVLDKTQSGATTTEATTFVHGPGIDEPLSLERNSQKYYYHADGLGSITSMTDGTEAAVNRYAYDSFGRVKRSETIWNDLTFTGREYDFETGLLYLRARYYDPEAGRFVSKDPIGFAGGDIGKPLIETNLYAYTGNSPVNRIDPFGLFGVSTGFESSIAGFGFGGTAGLYGNFSHDDKMPWYKGWSSSVTVVLGGGAAASVYGATAGVHLSGNNSCDVNQLSGGFLNAGRTGLGALSIGGYRSPDGSVSGGGITVGPSIGYIGGFGGGTYTWTLGGGKW